MASSQNKQGDRQHIDAFFYRTGNVHLSHLLYQHSIFNSATTLALTDACTYYDQPNRHSFQADEAHTHDAYAKAMKEKCAYIHQ